MKRGVSVVLLFAVCLLVLQTASAQQIEYLSPKPMSQVVKVQVKPFTGRTLKVPLITWGGDVSTILTEMNGIFKQQGLNVSLFREDKLDKSPNMTDLAPQASDDTISAGIFWLVVGLGCGMIRLAVGEVGVPA